MKQNDGRILGHGSVAKRVHMQQGEQEQKPLKPGLYIVATPIGNLGDITARALETLRGADVIACEDTRMTSKLLQAFLIKKPMMAYHEHNGEQARPKIEALIAEGKAIALVSDAGTPLISDPGYKLVRSLVDADIYVTTLPGPSALIAALTLAGLPTDRFTFLGFPPNKSSARKKWYEKEAKNDATLVFYESARRLPESLADAASVFGNRKIAVCREITKKFEEVVRGDLLDVCEHYVGTGSPKGEVVVVIEGEAAKASSGGSAFDTKQLIEKALEHMSVKSAAAFVADLTGERKKDIYQLALDISKNDSSRS